MKKPNQQDRKDSVVLIEEEYAQERAKGRTPETSHKREPETSGRAQDSLAEKILANWDDFKRSVRSKYTRLSDEDMETTQGRTESLIVKIQQRYPEDIQFTREQIQGDLSDICSRY